jgi:hypothetical protein
MRDEREEITDDLVFQSNKPNRQYKLSVIESHSSPKAQHRHVLMIISVHPKIAPPQQPIRRAHAPASLGLLNLSPPTHPATRNQTELPTTDKEPHSLYRQRAALTSEPSHDYRINPPKTFALRLAEHAKPARHQSGLV